MESHYIYKGIPSPEKLKITIVHAVIYSSIDCERELGQKV